MPSQELAIRVEGLGKKYVIGHEAQREQYAALRDAITRNVSSLWRRSVDMLRGAAIVAGDTTEEFWALRDVNFSVREGEVLGIIGHNGAGKSTLLKILSRITEPTEGRARIRGRVASLLEVGTGFHPELSGRANIFLNGAILGMTQSEIKRKFDEIVAFAEVERFLDTPVKRYSSGMYVRLAFAVAAHLEPEILIVDEVLAVGDAAFQRRCLGKMKEVSSSGRTVLFVSHNLGAMRALCDRGIVMQAGAIAFDGEPDAAISFYLSESGSGSGSSIWTWSPEDGPGTADVRLSRVALAGRKSRGSTFRPDEDIDVAIAYRQSRRIGAMRLLLAIMTTDGETAFVTTDQSIREADGDGPGDYVSRCTIPGGLLNRRAYMIRVSASTTGQPALIPPTDLGPFFIEGPGNDGSNNSPTWPGVVCPKIEWEHMPADEAPGAARTRYRAVGAAE
jgi:lipopolysaccharide transport system ATP-binding protein